MHTNGMKLESLETPTAKLGCKFASTIFQLVLLVSLGAAGLVESSFAQNAQAKTFASAGEAANALFDAAKKEEEPALEAILGAGKEVTSTGDDAEDKLDHECFSQKYQEMHRLVRQQDGTTLLYIGAENWPFPIPLVKKNGAWSFDPERGKQEILFRSIGENEATAIAVCQEFAIAKQNKKLKAASEDPITQFAESLFSASPSTGSTDSNLFHGYYFRTVTDSATVMSNGQKQGGLKLVAYPAEYKSSGVMTFVVTHYGLVFEKDLGPTTTTLAPQIKARTGSNWHPAGSS
jgi:Protein of unknown function (DUF2950)